MVAIAPIPQSELARLEALYSYQIIDTPPDERFDLFTRMCTWLFHVPIAAINLVAADNTFFKSLIGFPSYRPVRATSICAHAIAAGDAIMEIENLREDARFRDHPLTEKGLRFYAGALLLSPAGHPLGTLCIGDSSPRTLGEQDRSKLQELARGVSAVMELHRNSLWLLQAATEDVLTGLCNRRLFMERVQSAVVGARPDTSCVVLCLDLDEFKQVNDKYGHSAGDALLREVGYRLTASARAGDTVARLGGDEFAILLRCASTTLRAERLAQRVLAAFSAPLPMRARRSGFAVRSASPSIASAPPLRTLRVCYAAPTAPCTTQKERDVIATRYSRLAQTPGWLFQPDVRIASRAISAQFRTSKRGFPSR